MCRFLAYSGPPVPLETLVLAPENSLVDQSLEAQEAKLSVNGDGFGLAWYGRQKEPGIFKNILPAWSDTNLASLCRHIEAPLFLAHVRAATAGEITSSNTHPFTWGCWSFVHNGQISGYYHLRRALEAQLTDDLYAARTGSTDSELLFLLLIYFGLDRDVGHALHQLINLVTRLEHERLSAPGFRFTAALSNGNQLFGIRYASDDKAPTLYLTEHFGARACKVLASEPLTKTNDNWMPVPHSTFVQIDSNRVSMIPI